MWNARVCIRECVYACLWCGFVWFGLDGFGCVGFPFLAPMQSQVVHFPCDTTCSGRTRENRSVYQRLAAR